MVFGVTIANKVTYISNVAKHIFAVYWHFICFVNVHDFLKILARIFQHDLAYGFEVPAEYKFIRIQVILQIESSTEPILTQAGGLLSPNELFVHSYYTFYYRATCLYTESYICEKTFNPEPRTKISNNRSFCIP